MSTIFTMRLADVTVGVSALHEDVFRMCADYVLDGSGPSAPDLQVSVVQEDIERERALSVPGSAWSDAYLETLAVYRKIAEWAPLRDRMLIHGASIEYAGRAYLFCAPSGTGKSTHVRLWRTYLGGAVDIVNGDKPLVRIDRGRSSDTPPAERPPRLPATVYGTPWCGKEGWQRNVSAPLAGICLLRRAQGPGESAIRRIEPVAALDFMMRQVYLPEHSDAAAATLELLDALLARTPLFELSCDMSEDAVRVSFEGLTGEPYPSRR